jgi:hypothetical protein
VNNVVSCAATGLTNMVAYPARLVSRAEAQLYGEAFEYVLQRVAEGDACTFEQVFEHFHARK